MGVVWIREHWPNRSGTFETPLKSTARRHWRVKVNSKLDNAVTIHAAGIASGHFPDYLDPHPSNLFLRSRRIQIDNFSETWLLWEVTADYSSEPLDVTAEEENDTPPLDRSTKVTWDGVEFEQAVYKDRDGKAFLNSAGTPYAAQLIDDARRVIQLRRNVSAVPAFMLDIDNVVNASPYTISGLTFPAETLRSGIAKIGEAQFEQGQTFFPLSMSLQYKKDGWKLSLLDEGIYETGEVPILDDEDNPVREPVPLDGSGSKLDSPTPETASYNDFDVYQTFEFNNFPF